MFTVLLLLTAKFEMIVSNYFSLIGDGVPDAGPDSVDAGHQDVVAAVLRCVVGTAMAWKLRFFLTKIKQQLTLELEKKER